MMMLMDIARVSYNAKLSRSAGRRDRLKRLVGRFYKNYKENITMNEEQEHKMIWLLLSSLSVMCDDTSSCELVDLLTGHLWCEEEAGRIKDAGL